MKKMKKIASRGYSMPQPNDDYIHKLIEMVNTSPYPQHLLKSVSTGMMTAQGRCIRAGRPISYA